MAHSFLDKPFKTYLFSYRHDGCDWGLEIKATDASDAKERLKAITFARYDGELIAKIPVEAGWLAKAIVWCRNAWQAS